MSIKLNAIIKFFESSYASILDALDFENNNESTDEKKAEIFVDLTASDVPVDADAFAGNLDNTITNVQKLAEAVDTLPTGSSNTSNVAYIIPDAIADVENTTTAVDVLEFTIPANSMHEKEIIEIILYCSIVSTVGDLFTAKLYVDSANEIISDSMGQYYGASSNYVALKFTLARNGNNLIAYTFIQHDALTSIIEIPNTAFNYGQSSYYIEHTFATDFTNDIVCKLNIKNDSADDNLFVKTALIKHIHTLHD